MNFDTIWCCDFWIEMHYVFDRCMDTIIVLIVCFCHLMSLFPLYVFIWRLWCVFSMLNILNMTNVEIWSTTYFVNRNLWRQNLQVLDFERETKYLCQQFDAVTLVLISGFALHIVRNFVYNNHAIYAGHYENIYSIL